MVSDWYNLHNVTPLKPEYITVSHAKTVDRRGVADCVLRRMLNWGIYLHILELGM